MLVRFERNPFVLPFIESIPDLDRVLDASMDLLPSVIPFSRRGNPVALEISEDENSTKVVAELPGVSKDDVHLSFQEGVLTISGERNGSALPKDATRLRSEIPSGSFTRAIGIPHRVAIAGITAELKDGILTIVLPKAADARPRQIEVR